MRSARRTLLALAAGALMALSGGVCQARPPSVVLILADDVGYGDLASYGHPYARTPELDRLARQGTRFTQFYVTGSTCNPSRTGFMTARHPATFRGYTGDHGFADHLTVTELLASNGYRTGHFGKWHIGPIRKAGTYGLHEIQVIGAERDAPAGRDARVFDAAISFIERHRDAPFYVNIWGHISHLPIKPRPALYETFPRFAFRRRDFGFWAQRNFDDSEYLIDRYKLRENLATAMRKYLSEIAALDAQVGRLLDKLDQLGLANNTIVVFTSDQGPEPVFRDGERPNRVANPNAVKNLLGYAGGLRGSKHTFYEGGVRSPFIVRWPRRVPSRRVNRSSVISAADWLPTISDLAGIEIDPEALGLDGESIADIWTGAGRSRVEPLFWKTRPAGSASMRSGDWKLREVGQDYELYDLSEDPFEMDDLASSRPQLLASLRAELDGWKAGLPRVFEPGRHRSPRRPVAKAGPDRVVIDQDGDLREWVRLDASRSRDPDGSISGYVWTVDGRTVAVGRSPLVELELGEHVIVLHVTDYAKRTNRDRVRISVVP